MRQKIRYEFFFTHHPAHYGKVSLDTLAANTMLEHFPADVWAEWPKADPSQFPEDISQLSRVIVEGELTGAVDWDAFNNFLDKICESKGIGWKQAPLYNPSSMSRSTL